MRHRSRQSRANRRRRCCCNGDESPWKWKAESNNKRRVHEWKFENFSIKSICISNMRSLIKELHSRLQYILFGTDGIFRNDYNARTRLNTFTMK